MEPLELELAVACSLSARSRSGPSRRAAGGRERLGARGADLRERNARGWAGLVPHYERACRELAR